VTAYVDIRTFEQRLEYARQNVRIQEGSLELAQARSEEGKTGDISLYLTFRVSSRANFRFSDLDSQGGVHVDISPGL
jgi:hypothetical protein